MKFIRQRPEEVSINLTPLIDVVFLLLIFFMVSTTFTRESHLEVDLPATAEAAGETPQTALEIVILEDGSYRVNGEALADSTIETLREKLATLEGIDPEQPVVISADAQTPHQAVVTAMDAAGQSGFTRLSISTRVGDN